jgi:hypothetical protein
MDTESVSFNENLATCQRNMCKKLTLKDLSLQQDLLNTKFIQTQEELLKRAQTTIKDLQRRIRILKTELVQREKRIKRNSIRFKRDLRIIEHPIKFFQK